MNYEDLIRMIADWGLDGLDCTVYWFPDNSNEYLASIRKAAFKNGVQIYNAGVRVQLCQPTPELQLSQYENIKKWVDVADRLGASHMRVFGGPIPKGATEQQAIAWAVEVLKRGAEYAGSRGITLGVEDDGGLTTAAGPTVEIVKQAASPWAGINADSGESARGRLFPVRDDAPLRHERAHQSLHRRRGRKERDGRLETAGHDGRESRVQRLRRAGIRRERRRKGRAAPGSGSARAGSDGICMTAQT